MNQTMNYKEFLQALADAYKNTANDIGYGQAYMCLVLDPRSRVWFEEGIVSRASGIEWSSCEDYANELSATILGIQETQRCAWIVWAGEQFPEIATDHLLRAHWLQIQADNA